MINNEFLLTGHIGTLDHVDFIFNCGILFSLQSAIHTTHSFKFSKSLKPNIHSQGTAFVQKAKAEIAPIVDISENCSFNIHVKSILYSSC